MYFDDEKDVIGESPDLQIDDDGSVSWENILSDDNVVSADDEGALQPEVNADISEGQGDSLNFGDELEFIQNEDETSVQSVDYDISESEPALQSSDTVASDIPDAPLNSVETDEFDIDKQLEQVSFDETAKADKNFKMPEKKPQKSNTMTILLALLAAILVMGGIYYYLNFFDEGDDDLVPPSTKTQMDNVTQEEIVQRNDEENNENIPIVNEDNVDTLKPEEIPAEEKKEVIDIKPAGRLNPFLPLQKYVKADIPETFVQYDKVGIPTPPEKVSLQDEETTKMLTIGVSGIMYDDQKPSAIITLENNDYFVQKGDRLDEYNVVDIGKNYVTIAHGKNLYKANVGEEFKITSNFYGSAQYISQKQGGGRQYYSVSEEKAREMNSSRSPGNTGSGGRRYVSEEDVVIKSR